MSKVSQKDNLRVITMEEVQKHATLDDAWTVIYDKVYNITKFIKTHPGGEVVKFAAGRDGTFLYESYHPGYSMSKVEAFLEKLPVEGKFANPEIYDATFFTEVRSRVEKHLKANGKHRRSYEYVAMLEVTLTIALFIYSCLGVINSGSLFWSAIAGLMTGRLGFIMHTGNHCGASRHNWFNSFTGKIMDVIGGSHIIWSYEHQVAHHGAPNELGHDNDCEIGNPFIRLHPGLKFDFMQKFQTITLFMGMTVGFFKWYLSDITNILSKRVGHIAITAYNTQDLIHLTVCKSIWFALHIFFPCYYQGIGWGLFTALFKFGVGAHYLENIFIVNHIQESLIPPTSHMHWANKQVFGTANWSSASVFWNWFSGGLNHQIEHHLFPSVSTYLYPEISPIVKSTCEEFRIPYHNYSNLATAWIDMVSNIHKLSKEEIKAKAY